ncbi:hypothetical protein PCASD_22275 [Puccinia coronata f. sp. avenae]|uniref:Ubiquitin-like domain-containing protein n=1 Tax=Puccinia coronata f. sp. avenae TaxID=200324 RepID=A0A2N5SBL2_9BASI|nr:hypothetical protein PCASD_22275 [Puccinia coronata f. sp. avenae]
MAHLPQDVKPNVADKITLRVQGEFSSPHPVSSSIGSIVLTWRPNLSDPNQPLFLHRKLKKLQTKILYGETDSLILRVKTTTAFQKIFDVVAPRIGMHPNSFMFRHHGRRVLPNETTPADLNLGDDEVLQVEPRHNSYVEPQRETKITLRIQCRSSSLAAQQINRFIQFIGLISIPVLMSDSQPEKKIKPKNMNLVPHGSELSTLRVNRTTALQNIYNAVAQELLVEPDSFFLYYDGERLVPNENTPSDLNLDDNDVLDFRFTLPPNVTPNGVVLYLRVQCEFCFMTAHRINSYIVSLMLTSNYNSFQNRNQSLLLHRTLEKLETKTFIAVSDGSEQLILRVKTTTPCERIYHAVAQQKGAEPHSFRLHHDGEILPRNESTAADLNLENDAVLDNDGSEPLLMKVKTTTTFRKIYKAITQERRIYPDSFYLLYNGQRLLPNETTPSDLNLVNGQVLEHSLALNPAERPKSLSEFNPHGIESMTLRVNPTTAFQKIYEAVARAQGVEPNSFLLYHNGERLLSNETTLTDLNLDNDDVLDTLNSTERIKLVSAFNIHSTYINPCSYIGFSNSKKRTTEILNQLSCNGSESLMLRVKQTVAFQKIYDAVAQHMGLDPTSFSLHYHGQRLLPNKTPTDLNIHNNAVLNHFLSFPRPYDRDVVSDRDAKITLHIECEFSFLAAHQIDPLNGFIHGNRQGPITLRLKTTTTLRKIYDVVARVIDWELNTLFLVYDGRRLPSNETTPADWNIGNDAVLHLLLELRGGNASSFW